MKKNHLIFKTDQIQAIEENIQCWNIFTSEINGACGKISDRKSNINVRQTVRFKYILWSSNNGADGYLCSIISHEMGIPTTVIETQNDRNMAESARLARDKCKRMGIKLIPFNKDFCIDSGIIIDALVGSGLRDIPRDETRDIIEFINKQNAPIVSIDVPSGVTANSGHVHLIAVKADLTICT